MVDVCAAGSFLSVTVLITIKALICFTVVLPRFDRHGGGKKNVLYFIFNTCNCLSAGVSVVLSLA